MQCYAPSLHDGCVAATLNDQAGFDFRQCLADFSVAIFPLFVWNIWSYRTGATPHFTISDFLHTIEMGNISPENASAALDNLRKRVGRKIVQLQKQHPDAKPSYAEVKESMKSLGVMPDQTYMYIQGHFLFDKVVMPLLKKTCNRLMREREREITHQSLHTTQRHNELSCYSSSVADVECLIRRNVGYVGSPQFAAVIRDIEAYMNPSKPTQSEPQEAPKEQNEAPQEPEEAQQEPKDAQKENQQQHS